MSDTCKNQLKITGQISIIEDFYVKTGEQFWISSFYPAPEDAGRDWLLGHWGVKWDADNSVLTEHNEHFLAYEFETPWSPPLYAIEYISSLYKDALFEIAFTDLYSFYGINSYVNGVCIMEKHSPKLMVPTEVKLILERDKSIKEDSFLRDCFR